MSQHEIQAARRPNGQFGHQERAEGDVGVLSVPRGSFLYPPILHTAREAIAFWESVDIPDEVLQKTASAYVAQWAVVSQNAAHFYWDDRFESEWEAENPQPTDRGRMEAWLDAKNRAQVAFENHWTETLRARPEYLDPRDVRQVAKAVGLLGTPIADPEERALMRAHPIELTTGWSTVGEVNLVSGAPYFGGTILNPANYSAEDDKRIADIVARALEQERANLRSEFGTVNDNIVLAVQAITGYEDGPSGRRGRKR